MQTNIHTSDESTFDVVIVGRGPVGSTLANLLGQCGLKTLVLEREAANYHLPRAAHFDDELMRVFQTIGLSEAIQPHVILSPGMRFVDGQGRLVLDWSRTAEITPMGWHLSYRFHQPDLEDVLNAGLARWPSVTVRTRCDVFALDCDERSVSVRYEDLSSGRLSKVRARYVVGCDGARSIVRRFIGAGLDDLGFHERWIVIDVLLKRDRSDLGDYSIQHCNPERPATYIRGTGKRRRWEITVHPGEDAQAATSPARVWELLRPWIDPDDADIERAAVYTFHSAVAEQWRNGRLLLAGDSAHQTPPFLGQGMCAGVRDAANLAWKLERIVRGLDDNSLLDTYQSERAPHVREFIEIAIRLGGLINTKAMEPALALGERRESEPLKLDVKKPLLGPGLSAGSTEMAGQLAPQFTLSDGRRSDDVVGYRYCLLTTPALASTFSPARQAELARGQVNVLIDRTDALKSWLREHDVEAVMVRPDRYVLGAVKCDADLAALLSEFRRGMSHIALAG